jgi:hypothetical protein
VRSSPLGPWVWMTRQCGHVKPKALPLMPIGQHSSVGIVASFCMAQAYERFLQTRQGTGGVRVLFARLTRAPEAGHEPQIGAGLLLKEFRRGPRVGPAPDC